MMTIDDEAERKKRAIFEAMPPRRQQKILKKGYDLWDPFLPPKEPSRFFPEQEPYADTGKIQAVTLFQAFLDERSDHHHSVEYLKGAKEVCFGLCRGDERYKGMYAYCCWMAEHTQKEMP